MTPKQKVLRKYPEAYAYCWRNQEWLIKNASLGPDLSDWHVTAAQAWMDAALRMKARPDGR